MWLAEFHHCYPGATERFLGKRLDPAKLEHELSEARRRGQITANDLRAIEQSDAWQYPQHWPNLSGLVTEKIALPPNLSEKEARRQAIESLFERSKNIEAVSVALRFYSPDEFGILSFPVTNLIKLPQAEDHIDYYLNYLENLRDLRDHYGKHSDNLQRAADIDMALWSAAHLSIEYPGLTEEMDKDTHFQILRLRNVLWGLGGFWRQSELQYGKRHLLLFAEALLEHNHRVAALTVSNLYESLILEIGNKLRIHPTPKRDQTDAGAIVDGLDREAWQELGVGQGKLKEWWVFRNRAVHPKHQKGPLNPAEARALVHGTGQLLDWVEKSRTV